MAEQEDQGRVEGHWRQLGREEDLLEDQELVWRLDKELLLVFVRKCRLRLVTKCSCMKNLYMCMFKVHVQNN